MTLFLSVVFGNQIINAEIELAGLTNKNYLIVDEAGNKLVQRIPGYATAVFIDRKAEAVNSKLAYEFGFNPINALSFDPESGQQLSAFVEGLKPVAIVDLQDRHEIAAIAHFLHNVHHSQMPFENRVDMYERAKKLERFLIEANVAFPEEYDSPAEKIAAMKEIYSSSLFESRPCHGDPVPSNFSYLAGKLQLLDWETAGLFDPAWDLAMLSSVMSFSDDLERYLIRSYQSGSPALLTKKVKLLKPLVEYWLGLWGLLQTHVQENVADKDFFYDFARIRFCKSARYLIACEDNFLYDTSGQPLMLRLYIDSDRQQKPLVDFPILSDEKGRFFALKVRFGHWICPYCGILNQASTSHCVTCSREFSK